MNAVWRGFGGELRLLRREAVALWALGGVLVLLLAAALNGAALLGAQHAVGTELTAESATLVDALATQAARGVAAARDPGSVGFSVLGWPVLLPPAPLAPLAVGQADLLPAHYEISARGAHHFLARAELDSPLRLSIGNFDAAFVIVWLLPLLAVGLCHDIVSGERERGVLALAVAAGAHAGRFVLAKWVLRLLLSWIVLVVACVAMALITGALGTPQGPGRWLLWVGVTSVYLLFWFALALWINAGPHGSERNAAVLVGAWLLFVILAPALTNLVATTLLPAPSRVELTTELREATEAADRAAAATRDQYFFDHPEMRGGDMDTRAYFSSVARSEAQIADAMLPRLAAFDAQAERQQQLVQRLQYFSPGTVAYQALTAVAGSDGRRHREFRRQVLRYHADWNGFFVSRLEAGQALTPADYAGLPRFEFAEPPLAQTVRDLAWPLLWLAGAALALCVGAWRRLGRLAVV